MVSLPPQRVSETECEPGYWCADGERTACGAGKFGATSGLSTSDCSGLCEAGFVCSVASRASNADDVNAAPEVTECGSASVYCKAGSGSPTLASTGYYTTPTSAPAARRTGQTICPIGSFCVAGEASLCEPGVYGAAEGLFSPVCTGFCDPGRYGATPGATDKSCDGDCAPGYYCEAGSSSQFSQACSAGRFSLGGTDSCSSCDPGYYCPVGSVSSQGASCGGAAFFCTGEASSPTAVQVGWFSTPEEAGVNLRTGEEPCPPGSYCSGGVKYLCGLGRWGNRPEEYDIGCSGPCRPGRYGSESGQLTEDCVRITCGATARC